MEEDNLSSVSFVSSISAVSSTHQPRPPDGPKPAVQGFRSKKPGKVVRSPYLATSTPYPNKKQRRSTAMVNGAPIIMEPNSHPGVGAREKWAAAVRGYVPAVWASPVAPHSSASSFLQSLMKAPSFSAVVTATLPNKRKRTQSAAGLSSSTPKKTSKSVSGQMDAIALRDETVELKKALNAAFKERDLAKAQQVKLEKEVGRKDKQIEDLLASGHISSRDATRSLASSHKKKPHSSSGGASSSSGSEAVISSLRQKIHSLERVLREKDSALGEMKKEVGATRLKEMEIQTEVYYREICRLTHLVSHLEGQSSSSPGSITSPRSMREAQIKMKALNQATVKLSSQLEQAEVEKNQLMFQLEKYQSESPARGQSITHNEQGLRGSIADRYVDHSRSQMLSAIVDLELRIKEQEGTVQSLCHEMEQKKAHYERRIGDLSGGQNDSLNSIHTLKEKLSEKESSYSKLRNIVRKLKDDRAHYRALAENTQSELQRVQTKLQTEKLNKTDVIKELENLREHHLNEVTAREHARKLAKQKSQVFTPDREKQDSAATTIQRRWKKKQAVQRQIKFQEETEQASIDIQSALRGHLARKKMLTSSTHHSLTPSPTHTITPSRSHEYASYISDEDSDGSEVSVAVERIQSALRGHMARQMALQDLVSSETTDGDPVMKPSLVNQWRSQNVFHDPLPPGHGGVHSHSSSPSITSTLVGYHPPTSHSQLNLREVSVESALGSTRGSRMKGRRHHHLNTHSGHHHTSPWDIPPLSSDSSDYGDHDDIRLDEHSCVVDQQPPVIISSSTESESLTSHQNNPEVTLLDDELT